MIEFTGTWAKKSEVDETRTLSKESLTGKMVCFSFKTDKIREFVL